MAERIESYTELSLENERMRVQEAQERLGVIEERILNTSFFNPGFEELVRERNNLNNIINGKQWITNTMTTSRRMKERYTGLNPR